MEEMNCVKFPTTGRPYWKVLYVMSAIYYGRGVDKYVQAGVEALLQRTLAQARWQTAKNGRHTPRGLNGHYETHFFCENK